MITQAMLDDASRQCWERGIKILQGFRLGKNDRGHIYTLLWHMAPARNSSWIDIGCGFGEPAALMQEARPDLRFELVNNNEFQLSKVPAHLSAWRADMHQLPFLDQTFDGAMFLYSLCHATKIVDALQEAARVVKDRGRLFVFDYLREGGNNDLAWQYLGAWFFTGRELHACMAAAGWTIVEVATPPGSDAVFRSAFGYDELYDEIFAGLKPILLQAERA